MKTAKTLILILAFLIISLFTLSCRDSKQQIVFLCTDDNAWNTFESYLKKLDDEKRSYKLGSIVVKIWDGKEFKDVSIKWTDYLSGEGTLKIWQRKLSNIPTKCDPEAYTKAKQYAWEIYPAEPLQLLAQFLQNQEQQQSEQTQQSHQFSQSQQPQQSLQSSPLQQSTQPPAQVGAGQTAPQAQAHVPVEAKLNLQQGLNYMRAKDYDNAIREFTLAIEKYPNYDVAYSNRAVAYMHQKKFNKALDDLKRAEQINPNNPTVHYNYVALYSLQKQLDRALDHLDRALQLGFNNYDALRTDPDLDNVRKHPEFRKILEKHKVFITR